MRRTAVHILVVLALLSAPAAAHAQSSDTPKPHSHKGRIIGTLVGIGGGVALGTFAGMAWFDDAVNSDRKLWTTAALFSAAGGIGGYLIGNAIDKSGSRAAASSKPRLMPMPAKLPRLKRPPSVASPLAQGLFAPQRDSGELDVGPFASTLPDIQHRRSGTTKIAPE